MGSGAMSGPVLMDMDQIKREALEIKFNELGRDDAETMTKDELKDFLQKEDSATFTDDVCEGLWDKVDKNDDGNITVREFKAWLDKQKVQVSEAVPDEPVPAEIVPDTTTAEKSPEGETATEKSPECETTEAVAEKNEENPEVVTEKTEEPPAVPPGRSKEELMIAFNLDEQKMENILTVFKHIDKNDNGSLDEEEFVTAWKQFFDGKMDDASARQHFTVFDKNKDGVVNFDEFTELIVKGNEQNQQDKGS